MSKQKSARKWPRNSRKQKDQPFIAAIHAGDVASARRALAAGADVNCAIDFGTALAKVLADPHDELLELLLSQPGIDIDEAGGSFAPLDQAVLGAKKTGIRRWVERLLELGADVTHVHLGWTALARCVGHFPDELGWIEKLITPVTLAPKTARAAQLPTSIALQYDARDAFFLLLARGAALDAPELCAAAKAGATAIVGELLARGADANVRDGEGQTALMVVGGKHSVAIAKALLGAGADLDGQDLRGRTALFHSCGISDLELTKLFLSQGADTRLRDRLGRTVAFELATPASIEIAELLLAHGVDLAARDDNGATVGDHCREMAGVVSHSKGHVASIPNSTAEQRERMRSVLADTSREHREMLSWFAEHGVP